MNNDNFKISIITPTFNSAKTIKKTIESVLSQTYKYIEYIIVDGASTDNTLKIIEDYQEVFTKKGYQFKLISEPDNGIANAFNKGVKISTGDYVGIVNSDDWLETKAVELVVKNIHRNYSIYCGDLNLYKNNEFQKKRKSRKYLIGFGMYIMHPTVFVKRELYNEIQFNEHYKIAMDYDLIIQLIKTKRVKIKYIPEIISNMELGGISSNTEEMHKEELEIIKKYYSKLHYSLVKILKLYDFYKNTR